MSFLHHLVERIPEGIQRTEDTIVGPSFDSFLRLFCRSNWLTIAGILNPNSEIWPVAVSLVSNPKNRKA
jgi:hypothetical protein